jgi:hypothetical protein
LAQKKKFKKQPTFKLAADFRIRAKKIDLGPKKKKKKIKKQPTFKLGCRFSDNRKKKKKKKMIWAKKKKKRNWPI